MGSTKIGGGSKVSISDMEESYGAIDEPMVLQSSESGKQGGLLLEEMENIWRLKLQSSESVVDGISCSHTPEAMVVSLQHDTSIFEAIY